MASAMTRSPRSGPPPDDPLFHPYLFGSRLGAECRAGFYGLAGWHGEGHLLRALFEGVMFEHRRHIDVLSKAGAFHSQGGPVRRRFPQPALAADVRRRPWNSGHDRRSARDRRARCGHRRRCRHRPVRPIRSRHRGDDPAARHVHPDPGMRAHYDRRYALFGRAREAMRGIWADLRQEAAAR